jgi:hypothetical protein
MPSFSGPSGPFSRETACRVVACSSSIVTGNAPTPYQVFLSPLPFAFFRVFRGQFFSCLLSCPFACFARNPSLLSFRGFRGNLGPTKLRIARENKERENQEDCPRNTRKDARRRKENLRGILRTMPSFSGTPSGPFSMETACRVVACSSSRVAGNATTPYHVFLSPLHFAFFRVFRGQFFSSLLSCPFACFVRNPSLPSFRGFRGL